MNQIISNVLMQPKPTDADSERPMTLIEKLELEKECWHDDGENNAHRIIDDCIDIVKQHQAESGWISVDERLPSDGDIVEVYRNSYKWGDLVWQCLYTDKHSFRNYPAGTVGKNNKITHWRAIQPPSEVQDD